jgi:hypothetical protein
MPILEDLRKIAASRAILGPNIENYPTNPIMENISMPAYLLSPISSLPLPDLLRLPLDVLQTLLIEGAVNNLRGRNVKRRAYAEGRAIGEMFPFLRIKGS